MKLLFVILIASAYAACAAIPGITPLPDLAGDAPRSEAAATNIVVVAPAVAVTRLPADADLPTTSLPEPIPIAPPPLTPPPPRVSFCNCRVSGAYLALTFDDGPHPDNTVRLLAMLKQRGIKATFFCVGQRVADHPSVAKRIVEDGHEIGNHSWSHRVLSALPDAVVAADLERTDAAIRKATGVAPTLMRPPYGAFTDRQRDWAHGKWGYSITLWDVDSDDWRNPSAAYARSRILKGASPGSIVLSHDIHRSTVDGMPKTLDALQAKGFKFVTVSQLLALERETLAREATDGIPQAVAKPENSTVNPSATASRKR